MKRILIALVVLLPSIALAQGDFDCAQLSCYGPFMFTPTVTPTGPTPTVTPTPGSTGCDLIECDDPNLRVAINEPAGTTPFDGVKPAFRFMVWGDDTHNAQMALMGNEPSLNMVAFQGSPLAPTASPSLGPLFAFNGYAFDGTAIIQAGSLEFTADGAPLSPDAQSVFLMRLNRAGIGNTQVMKVYSNGWANLGTPNAQAPNAPLTLGNATESDPGYVSLTRKLDGPPALATGYGQIWTDADCLHFLDQSGADYDLTCGAPTTTATPAGTATETPTATSTPLPTYTGLPCDPCEVRTSTPTATITRTFTAIPPTTLPDTPLACDIGIAGLCAPTSTVTRTPTVTATFTGIPAIPPTVTPNSCADPCAEAVDWTRLQNYPTACSAGSFVSTLADVPTCTSNASTATALAANGTNCSAASFPLGVDASGNSEGCTTLASSNAGTATALAANGTNCSSGTYPLGVDASGNAESCGSAINGNAGTATTLAANPTDCGSNTYATTIDASGNLTCAAVSLTAGVTGILPIANGGTANSSALTNGQLWIGNTGNAPTIATLTGTTSQIVSTIGAGTITLSTPQNIATTSTPQFAHIGINEAAPTNVGIDVFQTGNTVTQAGFCSLNNAVTARTCMWADANGKGRLDTQANANDIIISGGGTGKLGLNATPSLANFAMDGTTNQVFGQERNTTAATAGKQLTVQAGGAIAGTNNLAGGDLVLATGTATGNGAAKVDIQTVLANQGSASTDRSPAVQTRFRDGHIIALGTAPTITLCGTSPSTVSGNDSTGSFTVGTIATTCTLTFAKAWQNTPHCVANDRSATVSAVAIVPTTTTMVFTTTTAAAISGAVIDYICMGHE